MTAAKVQEESPDMFADSEAVENIESTPDLFPVEDDLEKEEGVVEVPLDDSDDDEVNFHTNSNLSTLHCPFVHIKRTLEFDDSRRSYL